MLSQSEQIIRSAVKDSDVPFLGLLADRFTAAVKMDIEISVLANPTVHGYINYLQRYPALFSVNLSAHVMAGMGSAGHFELYPYIQEAIGTEEELTGPDREKLWRAYRQAILTLGLEPSPRVSGPHYMADEYLRQAGVPLAFIDDLAERMLSFAKRVGLPDQDDPEGVISWQSSLESRLEQPFSRTARKAVALDSQGFYTQIFLKVYNQAEGSRNALERGMALALKQRAASSVFRRAALPYLMLHDGTLGVFIAGGDERRFELNIDGTVSAFSAGVDDKFVVIHEPLPQNVLIREVNGHQVSQYALWEDNRPNRMLAFSDTGRFKGRTQLGQPEALLLPPGNYTFLSRFAPSNVDADELWSDPKKYAFQLLVHPGSLITIANGPANLSIQGESQPFAHWHGQSKSTKEGVEFFFGWLQLAIEFPVEWLALAGDSYVLRLAFGGDNERLERRFSLDADGRATLDISMDASKLGWRPAFGRILAEICRAGEVRAVLRTASFYWHGLKEVSKNLHFDCANVPNNFQRMLSANVCVAGTTLKPENLLARTLRFVFKLDERRNQSLSWNVPGVFVEVDVPSSAGHSTRHYRSLGSVEAISYTSAKQILVSATEAGTLSLGDWSQRVDFSKVQTKTISAAFLASRIMPKANNLVYRNEQTGVELILLRLVQPHHALKISSRNSGGQFVVRIDLTKEVTALLIRIQDIISGEDIELTLEANSGQHRTHRFGRAQLICSQNEYGGFSTFIHFELDIWPSGAWIFKFDGCIDGNWGHLENERQDQFAIGMLCENQGAVIGLKPFLACLTELPERMAVGVLERVQKSLLSCYATDSWTSLNWLGSVWEALLNRWIGREEAVIVHLVDLVTLRPPDDCAPSWMLQQTVASRLPRLFGLAASVYREVNEKPNAISHALRAIAQIDKTYPAIFPNPLHSAAATGFPNFAAVVNGAAPMGFLLSRYADALRDMGAVESTYQLESDNFVPGPGDFLGPLHYKHAMRQMELAFERSLGGNEIRCGQAIGLCSRVRRLIPVLEVSDAPRLAGHAPHVTPWHDVDDDDFSGDSVQRRENLASIAHTLSLLAYHCRLDARACGHLENFRARVAQPEIPMEVSLAYLLQVGEGVFAFYLLLWELVIKAEHITG